MIKLILNMFRLHQLTLNKVFLRYKNLLKKKSKRVQFKNLKLTSNTYCNAVMYNRVYNIVVKYFCRILDSNSKFKTKVCYFLVQFLII